MTLNYFFLKPWTDIGESSGFMGDTVVEIVARESMKQVGTTPLNSTSQGQTWQCLAWRHGS